MDTARYMMPTVQEGASSSTRFLSDIPMPSTQNMASCNVNAQGMRPSLGHQRSGIRFVENENSADPSHDATQLAYEIMQHKTTIQRIANAFAV